MEHYECLYITDLCNNSMEPLPWRELMEGTVVLDLLLVPHFDKYIEFTFQSFTYCNPLVLQHSWYSNLDTSIICTIFKCFVNFSHESIVNMVT